ncbi:cell division protein ZapD [Azoarcus communis]|uniref:Cell division protein ZapD n=1 Tax=Parazoarcus communis SWub3 = DSM 12120 TaxID=1121029 RepID=A0A323UUL6_9RHOO|nr:cell division protein ZapD [Parazoarcus communis]NMG50288.1 cell division protein ZapD [Parazoarcus communis]NMG71324.1 cell division protein ZapD [Parazoarcus communis SWub3 = DSM 12120]PZA15693.1 cell division protein ZapD [Azoarcus communis] [Parazoarcus communis SWub3 = DSM 12120]
MISYEYPLNERIRTLLRLEDLFRKNAHFCASDAGLDHHAGLLSLFEILEVAGRADLKVDLVQELERQRQILVSFRNNPEISEEALNGALYEIEQASAGLLAMAGKIGQYLRENEWLMSIRSRAAIPGGVCQFDLPSYHFWLSRDADVRRRDLETWGRPMEPIRCGLEIVLRLLRSSGRPENTQARAGTFQMTMAGRSAQMLRIRIPHNEAVIPEISANKYALNIRMMLPETVSRPRVVERDIPFELTFCSL